MMSLAEAAAAMQARVAGADGGGDALRRRFHRHASVGKGELFVAIRGERFDGHDFLAAAKARGAAAALVDEKHPGRHPCRCWSPTTRASRSGAWAGTGACASRRR